MVFGHEVNRYRGHIPKACCTSAFSRSEQDLTRHSWKRKKQVGVLTHVIKDHKICSISPTGSLFWGPLIDSDVFGVT